MKNVIHFAFVSVVTFWFLVLSYSMAIAHRVNVFVTFDGEQIKGYAYYSNGKAVRNAPVSIAIEGEKVAKELMTDNRGKFVFTPQKEGLYDVVLRAAEGHLAHARIRVGGSALAQGEMDGSGMIGKPHESHKGDNNCQIDLKTLDRLLSKRLVPIEQAIQDMAIRESEIKLHDVFAGLGYIFGIMGVWAYFASKKQQKSQ